MRTTAPLRRALGAASAALALLAPAALPASADDAVDLLPLVDPMVGTVAPGFTVPGAVVPFGMVQISPDTEGPFAYSGYSYSDATIRGFSPVHLSGPGVRKGGDVPMMPTVGPVTSSLPERYAAPLSHAAEDASAGAYSVVLPDRATTVELTATERTGHMRLTYPPAPQANVLFDVSESIETWTNGLFRGGHQATFAVSGASEVTGSAKGRYPVFFVAQFDRPFASTGTWSGETLTAGGKTVSGKDVGGWVSFDTTADREVHVKVGVSFVDVEGARRNLAAEAPGFDFDAVRTAARTAWGRELDRVRITGGTVAEQASFATALYHTLLHPNVFSDVDGRYLGFDGQVHVAEGRQQYANFSSWDTYKAQNQFLATMYPDRHRDMALSLLADAQQGGKLPRWGEWNRDSSHMSGDPIIPFLVDGWCRGVFQPQDTPAVRALYDEARELAEVHREPVLAEKGYLPLQTSSRGAGTTLEYGVADFALALWADGLGDRAGRDAAFARSANWRNLLDPETRWIRPRNADGSWLTPFDPTEETGFQEGNSWQYSWLLPHDARRLFDAMGGDTAAVARLDQLFAEQVGAVAPVAVAEAQARANVFGLVYRTGTYAPGNEHDIQIPWMYAFARQPAKVASVLRQIQGIFRPTPDGLPGNDDLGSLSPWHLFSAMGFGPVTPGAPFYVVGSPAFERVELVLPPAPGTRSDAPERTFVVEAPGASLAGKYVQSATLDGRPLDATWFSHADLADGGTLRLQMGTSPSTWGTGPKAAPPTAVDDLATFGCAGR